MNRPIENPVKSFLDKSISKRQNNTTYTTLSLAIVLLMAAWAGHSITDVSGDSIINAKNNPSTDTVFYWMETSIERLDKEFRRFVEKILRQNPRYWKTHTPYLLIDETHESYTGKLLYKLKKNKTVRKVCEYIFGYKPKKGDTGSFRFLTFALVGPTKKLIVRTIPLKADDGEEYDDGKRHCEDDIPVIIETIEWIRTLVKIRFVIMDRGFYNEILIQMLDKYKVPYIIRARISDAMQSMIRELNTTWASIQYNVGETTSNSGTETTLVIGKDKDQDWALITNRLPMQAWRLREYYRKRWDIENIFQVCDGINVHTNSTEIEKKTFCFVISCLIYNLWQFSKEKAEGVSLRRFAMQMIKTIEVELKLGKPPT